MFETISINSKTEILKNFETEHIFWLKHQE